MSITATSLEAARLRRAYETARDDLLGERCAAGHWIGELAASAVSTATAVSALSMVRRKTDAATRDSHLDAPIRGGARWLLEQQNADGGWGDTDLSYSNISAAMLSAAALHLASEEVGEEAHEAVARADAYIDAAGRVEGLRKRYGKDKTFAAPILANCALAGRASWKDVATLPFELACFPQGFYRFLQLPVVSYAIPALVAVGQARHHHAPSSWPWMRWIRRAAAAPSLRVLQSIQPASGGYLEATPLTSFVVMSLASIGKADHPVVTRGVQFLMDSMRDDGSWPIDTNLAAFNTSLSINALAEAGEEVSQLPCIDWLLRCQYQERHPYTGADPGGWGWTDLTGSVPDADDTPGALLALSHVIRSPACTEDRREMLERSAAKGCGWLLDLQNRDGGWPTFCRGWGALPFDRSGADLTAHAIRALTRWSDWWRARAGQAQAGQARKEAERTVSEPRIQRAVARGFAYLRRVQQADGAWSPLWFGNQDHPDEDNPVYGTSRVLLAYAGLRETEAAQRGYQWLQTAQNADGGWGGGPALDPERKSVVSSTEETALAVEGLFACHPAGRPLPGGLEKGLQWLVEAAETGGHRRVSPLGFYFAKLWYHERLYPLIFTVSALGRALRVLAPGRSQPDDPSTPTPSTPTPSTPTSA